MAIKVLVVDDEPDVAVIFRQKFRRQVAAGELEFRFAENGRLALEALQADPEISLVFTDIRMPTMDGLTFLKEIKALDRQVLLPIVVSAYDDMPNIREAMRQGAWDFVIKPIDLDDLERVQQSALQEIRQKLAAIATAERLAVAEQERMLSVRSKELQQEFFENITHEFRTPLTLLLAPLESALGLSSEPQVRDYLQLAQKGGVLLLDLVNQLLDFAKIDAQKPKPDLQVTDLSALIATLRAAFVPLAAQKDIQFEAQIAAGAIGLTDRRMLGRIALNLLSNAFKYTPRGGAVHLELLQMAEGIELRIQDTGPGLDSMETQQLFTRFQAGAGFLNAPANSSGLGLSICKSLCNALGGAITLELPAEGGTRFLVSMPIEWREDEPALVMETAFDLSVSNVFEAYAAAEEDDREDLPMVLVVEDHPDMRRFLSQILQQEFKVVAVENGRLGLEKAREWIPDLVLSDWMMPEMDGLELLKNLRVDRDTHHIPVVMLTAKASMEAKLEGIATGAEAFLPKPFHPDELLAVLHNLLAQRDRLRERFRAEILHPDKMAAHSMEDVFIADVKRVMEKYIMDEQFGVESMADALAMSRRTLMRKLSAVTGQAPVKFIRTYRLERALQMLQENTAPVWEIAVKTGFGSASYFTKCFKDHYGKSPKEAVHHN